MMTKTGKTAIFFINMRIPNKRLLGQLTILLAFFAAAFCVSCDGKKEEIPVVPPVTSPLTRDYIGFGVIKDSFTHICADPVDDSPSLGYLRRGSLVKVVRRQVVKTKDGFISWVLTDAGTGSNAHQQGWLKEEVMDIYENESQAKTASESLLK